MAKERLTSDDIETIIVVDSETEKENRVTIQNNSSILRN
jgi:hypothetical protein